MKVYPFVKSVLGIPPHQDGERWQQAFGAGAFFYNRSARPVVFVLHWFVLGTSLQSAAALTELWWKKCGFSSQTATDNDAKEEGAGNGLSKEKT